MRRLTIAIASSAVLAMAAPMAAWAQDKDIFETAVAAGTFKTFTRALTEAGLLETLKGPGPFTVLAPSDEAFAKLPKASLDALFANKSALRNVLLYHVIAGRLTAANLSTMSGKSRKTVEGSDASIAVTGAQLSVGTAIVITSDIAAKNGIIHVIDRVMTLPAR
jgi:uncharacterized surface protein with fasciclin (FAS1) repeats